MKGHTAPSSAAVGPSGRSSGTATLGHALEAFQRHRDLTPAGLATWLSMDPEALPALAAVRRPEPDDADFNLRCAEIAENAACDAFALRILLRWLRSSG